MRVSDTVAAFCPSHCRGTYSKVSGGNTANAGILAYIPWPAFNPALLIEDTMEIPVQVNGKLRDKIVVSSGASQAEVETAALACEKIKPFMEGKAVKKIIIVPKRLVNIVVG